MTHPVTEAAATVASATAVTKPATASTPRGVALHASSSQGRFVNSGNGPSLQPWDIGHETHVALIGADAAFWALVRKEKLADILSGSALLAEFREKEASMRREMEALRFSLRPTCVYFNPTARCNLNCTYCYLPEADRRSGDQMGVNDVLGALDRLQGWFAKHLPEGRLPEIIFHGAEPLLNREAIFAAIERYGESFRFGVQTNGTLLDDDAIAFLTKHRVGIGLSLDGPSAEIADRTRATWGREGTYGAVQAAIQKLRGYAGYNVICTITSENVKHLDRMVDTLHDLEVPACMLNIVRCTLPSARTVRPDDATAAEHYLRALERSHELYVRTGRKLVVVNFANVLLAILAPTARRLMCDISPCGGGRSFFAVAANGDLFPCSEFIGVPAFRGGNLFRDDLDEVLRSPAFGRVTGRRVEAIDPCQRCAIRHFCGAPCPAEAHEMNGGMDQIGGFCEFYEEQVRYAFRLIADGRENDFLWDGWADGTQMTFGRAV